MQKERAAVTDTPSPITTRGASLTRDTGNVTLSLVRVQPSETSRAGRNLVRFLSDFTQSAEKPVPVVAPCDHCGRFWNVSVDFSDADAPVVRSLPDNCCCGTPLDTPEIT
jgi:hypothetical protein